MEPKVLFEDGQILVIEKPAGTVTTRAKTVREKTIQEWVEEYLNPKSQNFLERAGIVHRLDKETSGLLLVAKTPAAFVSLQRQFKERKVKKKYLALIYGKVEPKEGEIRVPVGRLAGKGIRFGVRAEGKKAESKYTVCSMWYRAHEGKKKHFSLLEFIPKTGRTHQIRVHLKYFGHPIVADLKYGGKRAKKDRVWCPRLFLHACCLGFSHPVSGKWVEFRSELPPDLKKVLAKIKIHK